MTGRPHKCASSSSLLDILNFAESRLHWPLWRSSFWKRGALGGEFRARIHWETKPDQKRENSPQYPPRWPAGRTQIVGRTVVLLYPCVFLKLFARAEKVCLITVSAFAITNSALWVMQAVTSIQRGRLCHNPQASVTQEQKYRGVRFKC